MIINDTYFAQRIDEKAGKQNSYLFCVKIKNEKKNGSNMIFNKSWCKIVQI